MAEIIITIKNRRNDNSKPNSGAKPNSLRSLRGAKKPLKRRLKKSASGTIKFYDLGRIFFEGSLADNYFSIAPDFYPDSTVPLPLELSQIESFNNFYLENETASLESSFYRVEQSLGEKYKINVFSSGGAVSTNPANENWTQDGLNVSAEILSGDNLQIAPQDENLVFYQLVLSGASKDHITNAPDASAPAVSYNPSGGDKVFLIPPLIYSYSIANQILIEHFYEIFSYGTAPREIYLDEGNEFYDMPLFGSVEWSVFSGTSEIYGRAYKKAKFNASRGGGTGFESVDSAPVGNFDPENFPPEEYYPAPPTVPTNADSLVSAISLPTTGFPVLKAIIKQGNNFFYVWSN